MHITFNKKYQKHLKIDFSNFFHTKLPVGITDSSNKFKEVFDFCSISSKLSSTKEKSKQNWKYDKTWTKIVGKLELY